VASLSLLVGEAMEMINFYGTVISRRVISLPSEGVVEYGVIVYVDIFYRVRRCMGSVWQVVGTLG
jgi:hypothetical protein